MDEQTAEEGLHMGDLPPLPADDGPDALSSAEGHLPYGIRILNAKRRVYNRGG